MRFSKYLDESELSMLMRWPVKLRRDIDRECE